MKKLIVLIFYFSLFTFHFSMVNAQAWSPLGSGLTGGSGGGPIAEYNGNLWVGGLFNSAGGFPSENIAQWNNSTWIPIANGFNDATTSGTVYNNDLYVGGSYSSVAGKPIQLLARWNGIQWDSVGKPGLGGNGVFSLDTFKGKLYAAGWFNVADGFLVNNIASWDGTKWDSLDNGVGTPRYGQPTCICVYNNVLYVGGVFDTVDRKRSVCFAGWNGTNWITFDTVVNDIIYAMAVYKGELYIGGWFSKAGGVSVRSIAKWNGSTWSDVGGGVEYTISTANYRVQGLAVYNGYLYVGGTFDTAGGMPVHNLARWDGTTWSDVDKGVWGGSPYPTCGFFVYDSSLYVGGEFDTAGGLPANNIAKWTTTDGIENIVNKTGHILVYPNPSNGSFALALQNVNEPAQVEIYNMLGEKVYTTSLPQTPKGALIASTPPLGGGGQGEQFTIDLSSQPSGVYFYRVISETGSLVGEGKMVIQFR